MRRVFTLTKTDSDKIAAFWKSYGSFGCAMLAQPVLRDGRYLLRIRIYQPETSERINEFLSNLPNEKST